MALAHLSIGTATERIHLLSRTGFHLADWTPLATDHEAFFGSSSLAEGRQLRDYRDLTVIESFDLKINHGTQDDLTRAMQDLRRMLRKALDYWATDWQGEVVYLEARASCETNTRYAVVHDARLPHDDNPYMKPFIGRRPAMDNLVLLVERGPWLASIPGTGECVEASGEQEWCFPHFLVCDGDTQDVDCGSGANLDNLPDFGIAGKGPITVDGWIRPDSYGELDTGYIAGKANIPDTWGWAFYVSSISGLVAKIRCADQIAVSKIGLDDFTADGEWHYVLMCYDERVGGGTPAPRLIYLNVDGVWAPDYDLQQVSIGNYAQETNDDLHLANRADLARGFDGALGWLRVSDGIRYDPTVGNFTPPPRCVLPIRDANTMGQWIKEGTGTAIADQSSNGNTGTAANDAWDCDCAQDYGREATCLDEVYIANKHNKAQITNVHYWNGAAWSPNLMGAALPFDLLPNPVTNQHLVVFGIDSTVADSGPFASLVFDLARAITDTTTIQWRYSDVSGADPNGWAPLTVQDNTNQDGLMTGIAFDTLGVNSVHWIQPSGWLVQSPTIGGVALGVTGLWVCADVDAAAGTGVPPQEQNRDVYTITWPCIEVAAAQVLGDIPALARVRVHNQSDADFNATTDPLLGAESIRVGLRSMDRGADFSAYINLAQEQNPVGISAAEDDPTTSFATDLQYAPSGECIRFQPGGVIDPARECIQITFSAAIWAQYYGKYHVFIRARQVGGNAGDMSVYMRLTQGVVNLGTAFWIGETGYTEVVGTPYPLDCGRVVFPIGGVSPVESYYPPVLHLYLRNTNAAATDLYLYDVILLPVDEWGAEFVVSQYGGNAQLGGDRSPFYHGVLDIDSMSYPKLRLSAQVRMDQNDQILFPWRCISNNAASLRKNTRQRLWFYMVNYVDTVSHLAYGHSLTVTDNERYLSMRGDR